MRLLLEGNSAVAYGPGGQAEVAVVGALDEQAVQVDARAVAVQAGESVFCREGEYWTVAYEGSVVHLKDAKGLRHLARLLAHPGREFHATDLEAAERQAAPRDPRDVAGKGELAVRPDLGDAGALLDATAKAAYQARLKELEAELEEAERFNDPVRAAKARHEMDFLVGELARAVGLGGRGRRAASHAERARLNATRAIRAAMSNLARANPSLGRHLSVTIRTGRYCSYTPDPRVPIVWRANLLGYWGPGLDNGASGLNALAADGRTRGEAGVMARRPDADPRSSALPLEHVLLAGTAGRGRCEAADVLIGIWIERTQPPAGTAAIRGAEPLRFDGWLELLRVIAELAPRRPRAAWMRTRRPIPYGQPGGDTLHPRSPAHD
jgi:hypothetical protein